MKDVPFDCVLSHIVINSSLTIFILKTEAIRSFETSVLTRGTGRHTKEDDIFNTRIVGDIVLYAIRVV
jgi:hypothetical protein